MVTKLFSTSVMFFFATVLASAAMASAFLGETVKSVDVSPEESDEQLNVMVDERDRSSEFHKESNFDEFRYLNWHQWARDTRHPHRQHRIRCPANLGSGSCRYHNDCLSDERCCNIRLNRHFKPSKRWALRCCVRRPATTSTSIFPSTINPTSESPTNATTDNNITSFVDTTTEPNTLPTVSLQR